MENEEYTTFRSDLINLREPSAVFEFYKCRTEHADESTVYLRLDDIQAVYEEEP